MEIDLHGGRNSLNTWAVMTHKMENEFMENIRSRLRLSLMAAALGWSAQTIETNELVTGAGCTADLGKCRLTFSKYGTISSLQAGGKKILSNSFLLFHYADAGKVDSRVYEGAEDAARNPARVVRNEHAVTLTKKSVLGHSVNPESVLVNREIILDDKGKLTVRFEMEYLKDVVLTAPPLFLMCYELAPLSGGYMIDGKLGVLQDAYADEGQFGGISWDTKKIQFSTEEGVLSLEAMDNTSFSGYDLRRGKPGQGRTGQALRIDAFPRPGIYAPRYPFAKGTKQSFGFTITLPGL